MRELAERSRELQDSILRNQALLGELSERIAKVLDGRVKLSEEQAYVFVPRVYRHPLFLPEIFMAAVDIDQIQVPGGLAGPYDPWIVEILDKERLAVAQVAEPDPEPWKGLREQILADPALFAELSEAIAEVLDKHGIGLEADETYAFEAVMGPTPLFSSQLAACPFPCPSQVASLDENGGLRGVRQAGLRPTLGQGGAPPGHSGGLGATAPDPGLRA